MVVNITKALIRSGVALSAAAVLWLLIVPRVAAQANGSWPPIIQAGFSAWTKSGVDLALDAWQKGGLLEGDRKVATQSSYFRRIDRAVGNYKSFEMLEVKRVGQNSQIVYFAINFEHAAVYARFALYRNEKEWVVQNMDFSTKHEAIMPWLAFEGVRYDQ